MDAETIAAMLFGESILPMTVQDSVVKESTITDVILVEEITHFVSLVDYLSKVCSAQAPRIPLLQRDRLILGP